MNKLDFINKVYHEDARKLLHALPSASIDAVITDAMYGTSKNCQYEWGLDPARGDPDKHWQYHQPIYRECLRVLKPGGILAWAQGAKFCQHFRRWFGDHRLWTLTRFRLQGMNATGHTWIVQTREQKPVEFPHRDSQGQRISKVFVGNELWKMASIDPRDPDGSISVTCLLVTT